MDAFSLTWSKDLFGWLSSQNIYKVFEEELRLNSNETSTNHFKLVSDIMASIRNRLYSNQYEDIGAWIKDMRVMFARIRSLFPFTSLMGSIMSEMERQFEKKIKHIPSNKTDLWMKDFVKAQRIASELIESCPI